ncbi:LacI family transcriptional regulator [Amycolatopsis sp. NBRC 101858]|uniref:LacI family DNA-binding transcriptional regulator n=1 Tax=Amycolatopsis sp. NBRC 101858 TaxID=3032200 RepID=UPI0024A4B1C7|nr:LacI family DNA-binding transcriptional regulator [Amycolatopsis sp. NBRC 101858]GLY37374.1 LacI family transcriptional regulator [Amycolatopsis sp. NBRC 101858]
MKRPTITDIAREAGVSKGAVSYALNGRPGVSEATRHRITRIARELGWSPSSTARALSGGRAGAIGLVLDGPSELVVPALLDGFSPELVVQVATGRDAVLAVYRRWRAERKVDGVLLTDPDCAAELARIGLPAVVLGGPGGLPGVPSVRVDDTAGAAEALEYLAALGHRRVVRIPGAAAFAEEGERAEAFTTEARRLGLAGGIGDRGSVSGVDPVADFGIRAAGLGNRAGTSAVRPAFRSGSQPAAVGVEPSADAVRHVLTSHPRPTALLCDTDVLAVAALVAARELGLAVPGDLSVVSWDDSVLCHLVRPALTAIRRPLPELGGLAASMLRDLIAGEDVGDVWASRPRLITRGSTGPAR